MSTLFVFWQVHNFDFVNYDDSGYVCGNPRVLSGLTSSNIIWAFTTCYLGYWQPLTWLSMMLNCQLFGPDPGWVHLVNVFLHLANALLVFVVLRKMTGSLWPSAFVAAAFALHPMHVESVAWVAERKDVLSTFFLLLTLAAYAGYVKRPSAYRYLASLVLFAFGLMAKPMLVTLPFVMLLLDYWPLNRLMSQTATGYDSQKGTPAIAIDKPSTRGCLVEKIPFFALSIISSIVTFLTQRAGGGLFDTKTITLSDRVSNVFSSYAAYIGKMFWPRNLAIFYPFNAARNGTLWQPVLYALLLVGVSLAVLRFRRNRKYLLVGWLWFVGTLLPVIGLVQFTGSSYADRFTYVPYIGLFMMIAWGIPELLSRMPRRKTVLGLSMVIALMILGLCAHRQVSYWRNSITLFTHAVEVAPDNRVAYHNLGFAYSDLGRWQEAIEEFGKAIEVKPDDADAYNNRGLANSRLGRRQEAIDDYKQAIKINPDHAEAQSNLGDAYDNLGRVQEAIDAYRQAVRIRPDWAEAHSQLGIAMGKQGMSADACTQYAQAIQIKPGFAEARYNLANELAGQGRYDEALDQYHAALSLKPDWPDCMNNLAFLIAAHPQVKGRDTNEAVRLASHACERTSYGDPVFLDTLATAYASAGRFSEAVNTANKALTLADAASQPQLRTMVQSHLSLYSQGKPYVEPAPEPLPDPNKL